MLSVLRGLQVGMKLDGWGSRLGIIVLLLALALYIYGSHPIKRWKYRQIPGPPPRWLVGNLPELIRLERPKTMQQWSQRYGPVFKIWQGADVMICVEDPLAVRKLNMHNHERPPILASMLGEEKQFDEAMMLVAGGKMWQALRQTWQFMFSTNSLRSYTAIMHASAQRLANVLGQKAESGETVEMWRLLGCLTLEVIGATALGVDVAALKGDSKAIGAGHDAIKFHESDDDATSIQKATAVLFGIQGAGSSPYAALKLLFPELTPLIGRAATMFPDSQTAKVLQGRRAMRRLCYRLIDKTKQQMQTRGTRSADSATTAAVSGRGSGSHPPVAGAAKPNVDNLVPQHSDQPDSMFIARLLEAENKLLGRGFTDFEVAAQINLFILAGYETTASSLAFTVYHVAANPDKEAKLLQEIDSFGRDFVPTLEDLDELPYLDAVFRESLRLSPPLAFGTIRVARQDTHVCGYDIRKGWWLNSAQFSHQRNPGYWSDPDKFVPERFLGGGEGSCPAWAPFGGGGRSCVGSKFATVDVKITLIELYKRFTLRLVSSEPLETRTTLTMSPKHGVEVTVHPRM